MSAPEQPPHPVPVPVHKDDDDDNDDTTRFSQARQEVTEIMESFDEGLLLYDLASVHDSCGKMIHELQQRVFAKLCATDDAPCLPYTMSEFELITEETERCYCTMMNKVVQQVKRSAEREIRKLELFARKRKSCSGETVLQSDDPLEDDHPPSKRPTTDASVE